MHVFHRGYKILNHKHPWDALKILSNNPLTFLQPSSSKSTYAPPVSPNEISVKKSTYSRPVTTRYRSCIYNQIIDSGCPVPEESSWVLPVRVFYQYTVSTVNNIRRRAKTMPQKRSQNLTQTAHTVWSSTPYARSFRRKFFACHLL